MVVIMILVIVYLFEWYTFVFIINGFPGLVVLLDFLHFLSHTIVQYLRYLILDVVAKMNLHWSQNCVRFIKTNKIYWRFIKTFKIIKEKKPDK